MKILVMGLPGSGKTYLSERLVTLLNAAWYNADVVRKMANDWDFYDVGRIRQSKRLKTFADFEKSHERFVVCDFVCPTHSPMRYFALFYQLICHLTGSHLSIYIQNFSHQLILFCPFNVFHFHLVPFLKIDQCKQVHPSK